LIHRIFSGRRTPVVKRSEWALFGISDLNIALMKLQHFAGFSKDGRIGNPEIL
jgi:hypothetical protein